MTIKTVNQIHDFVVYDAVNTCGIADTGIDEIRLYDLKYFQLEN